MTDPEPPLVLVVDDYPDTLEMYAECLRVSGFRVAEARTGLEAVARARALRPAAVLMDLSLPGIDGWEATRQLKSVPGTAHIPVVAITGHASPVAWDQARDAGCAAFVLKPALPDDVVREIRRVLDGAAAPRGPDR
ncbi:MAG: response regulator [Vicinamibacterales bacterium]